MSSCSNIFIYFLIITYLYITYSDHIHPILPLSNSSQTPSTCPFPNFHSSHFNSLNSHLHMSVRHPLKHGKSTRDHIHEEKLLFLPQLPIVHHLGVGLNEPFVNS